MAQTKMSLDTGTVGEDAQIITAEMGETLQRLSGSTLLVTGAAGFLCSYFLDVVATMNETGSGPPCRVMVIR